MRSHAACLTLLGYWVVGGSRWAFLPAVWSECACVCACKHTCGGGVWASGLGTTVQVSTPGGFLLPQVRKSGRPHPGPHRPLLHSWPSCVQCSRTHTVHTLHAPPPDRLSEQGPVSPLPACVPGPGAQPRSAVEAPALPERGRCLALGGPTLGPRQVVPCGWDGLAMSTRPSHPAAWCWPPRAVPWR